MAKGSFKDSCWWQILETIGGLCALVLYMLFWAGLFCAGVGMVACAFAFFACLVVYWLFTIVNMFTAFGDKPFIDGEDKEKLLLYRISGSVNLIAYNFVGFTVLSEDKEDKMTVHSLWICVGVLVVIMTTIGILPPELDKKLWIELISVWVAFFIQIIAQIVARRLQVSSQAEALQSVHDSCCPCCPEFHECWEALTRRLFKKKKPLVHNEDCEVAPEVYPSAQFEKRNDQVLVVASPRSKSSNDDLQLSARLHVAAMPQSPQSSSYVAAMPPSSSHVAQCKIGGSMLTEVDNSNVLDGLQSLLETNPEWLGQGRDVAGSLRPGYCKLHLVRAWQVQNNVAESRYKLAREEIEQQISDLQQTVPHVNLKTVLSRFLLDMRDMRLDLNECIGLHGTKPSSLPAIFSAGLNERVSSGAFGHGCYFAEDAGKCDQYCEADDGNRDLQCLYQEYPRPENVCYMLVCKVLLGFTAISFDGQKTKDGGQLWADDMMRRELATIPGAHIPYHGLLVEVGQAVKRYREVVAFHSDRIVIKYLIAYQRTSGHGSAQALVPQEASIPCVVRSRSNSPRGKSRQD